ncbi:MAG: S-methyl-5-thioribose-1-phosphate isomerase [Deltaproteobacteria bacterium]|nr:S-methyl-5-thioribose-1-phosphate isomerase [Deltaproteobacteria bacterium]
MIIPIKWQDDQVWMLDQRQLPWNEVWRRYTSYQQVAKAISVMVIRGAPAIGVAAAMGYALGALHSKAKDGHRLFLALMPIKDHLARQRPTAVNLVWALNRMEDLVKTMTDRPVADIKAALANEAVAMQEEDIAINRRMGVFGAELVPDQAVILTHCNAGALATGGYGTALGVIRAAVEAGKKIQVLADETRPFLQGARLTAWELMKDNIPVQVITDNMAGHFMKLGRVDLVIVGADRIAANGDTANKIGTYSVAVLAGENRVPFYVAAPLSTIDLRTKTGDDIPIEQRPDMEITHIRGRKITPDGVSVLHPAFDVTPNRYITGIITEKGVARPDYFANIKRLFEK